MGTTMSERIVIKYHNQRMLLTIDFNMLVSVLLREFGPELRLELEAMTDEERADTANEVAEVPGLLAVRERFHLFAGEAAAEVRRQDLEREIVAKGQK